MQQSGAANKIPSVSMPEGASFLTHDQENTKFTGTAMDERSLVLNAISTYGVKAAAEGKADFVKKVVEKAASIADDSSFTLKRYLEACNEAGHNMLHAAIIHKRLNVIKILFNYANYYLSNSLTNDEMGDTPLTLAIRTYNSISVLPTTTEEQDPLKLITASLKLQESTVNLEIIKDLINFGSEISSENSKGDTPLILATRFKNHDVVKELCLHSSLKVDHKNICGKTALHYAVELNHTEIAKSLLESGASIQEVDGDGYTPVHIACKHGREELLVEMLGEISPQNASTERVITDSGNTAVVNLITNDGKTPLLVARCASNPSLEIIKTLLDNGSDLEKVDHFKNTALHLFNAKDDVEACTAILDKAREQSKQLLEKKNINLEIPLHVAASVGHLRVCRCFLENVRIVTLTYKDVHGYTPVMKAIAKEREAVVKEMLKYQCKVTEEVQHRKTLLEWSIENEHSVLIKAMLSLCTESGNGMEEEFEGVTVSNLAKLAAKLGKDKILQLLLQESAVRNLSCEILSISVEHGHLNCVKAIFEHKNQLPGLNLIDNNPLHIACRHGHFDVVKYLLGQSADPNRCNCDEGLPISCAASNGHEQLVIYLLDNGASLAARCSKHSNDRSPLLLAAMNGHERVVQILLQKESVDVNIRSCTTGYNCLCEAVTRGHRSTALAILKSDKWEEAMKFRTDKKNETPLRLMIEHMPDLAEYALYRCIEEEDKNKQKKIIYSFELLDDCTTCDGAITNFVSQKVKKLFMKPNNNLPVDREAIEMSTSISNPHAYVRQSSHITVVEEGDDYRGNIKWLQPKYNKQNDILQLMVKHKRILLLKHPIVSEMLKYKWRYFGLPAYIFHFIFYVMVVALLTSMILITPLPHGPVCSFRGCWSNWGSWSPCLNPSKCNNFNVTRTRSRTCNMPEPGLGFKKDCHGSGTETMVCSGNESNLFPIEVNDSNSSGNNNLTAAMCKDSCRHDFAAFMNMSCQQKGMSDMVLKFLDKCTKVLLVIVALLVALNIHKCYRRQITFFKDLSTYIEGTLTLSTVFFVVLYLDSSQNCFCASTYTWETAVVAVFFGWIGLIIHLTKFPLTGIIINMLLSIFYTFMKLVIIAALLCFAFALPFYMLLTQPGRRTPFSSIGRSMLKTLVMTTGEFEFDTIFVNEQELVDDGLDLLFPALTSILWIVFVVTMPILFNNLLVGLAVGDTQEQMAKAELTKFQLQIRIITEIQKALPAIHLIKRKSLVVSNSTCSWAKWFYSMRFHRREAALNEWRNRPDIAQFFDEYERDDPIEKIIAIQNTHFEKLNQMEQMLTLIMKNMEENKSKLKDESGIGVPVMANKSEQ